VWGFRTMINKFSAIFYSGVDSNTSNNDIRKYVIINILLLVSGLLLFFFSLYNTLTKTHYPLAGMEFIASFINLYTYIEMKKIHSLKRGSLISTLNAFFFLLASFILSQGADLIFVWVIFFPVFAIFINGAKKGVLLSFLFYSIVFYFAYMGLGKWMDGLWNMASFMRFISANLGMLFVTYLLERSFEAAYKELAKNRDIEQEYIVALEKASTVDPLTELYNRRHLDYLFNKRYDKAKEHNSYFALFILDLDKFKDYNDTYGHIAGDKALKKIADVLKQTMQRNADSVFRMGGEEFAGLVMAESLEKVCNSISNVKANIEALSIEHVKSSKGILTASIGVCVIHDFSVKDFDKMYKIADEALYKAKSLGRNSIVGCEDISTL